MADETRILALFGGAAKLGSERANLEALSALRQGGAAVRLIMSDAPWADEIRDDAIARGFDVVQCPYLLLPRPERRFNPLFMFPPIMAKASWILLREIRRFNPNYIYTSSQMFVLNFLPALAISSKPLIYRCGDKPILHSWIFKAVWHFTVARAKRIVAVSKFIANMLVETGVSSEKVVTIYARPPSRLVTEVNSDDRPSAFTFAFVGQINKSKGPHLLIEAFNGVLDLYPDAHLTIAGRISDWEGDRWARVLRDRVKADPNLSARVSFPGFVEDVQGLLAGCRVVVVPTITAEPLANVVMEAKLARLPAIVFPSGGLPEIVEHGVDGYICGDATATALRKAMTWYLEHPVAAKLQGEAAQRSLRKLGVDDFVANWMGAVGRDHLKQSA